MSYHGGGRRRYHPRDDYDRREVFETPEDRLKSAIWKYGEVDAIQELPRLAKQIREHDPLNVALFSEAIRIGVTEQPFKIPYYVTLLRTLHDPPETTTENTTENGNTSEKEPSLGRQILEDLWKGFQGYLDKLAWREIRLCIHLFAHLAIAKIVSPQSMYELIRSFTSVLDEFGVSHGRAKKAALCAAEGLMLAGPIIKETPTANVVEVISGIQAYIDLTVDAKRLVQPTVKLYSDSATVETADELLDFALASLQILNASDFAQTSESVVQPYAEYDPPTETPFEIPSVLVPPEVIELDSLSTDSGEDAQVKKEEWPEFYIRLFDNDVTPDPTTPTGYAIRSGILDLVDIFEVNRKECARLLLEFPKWLPTGTFKPRPGAPAQDVAAGKDWSLDSTIIETILGSLFLLPEPSHKAIYYITLITELCKLSPTTVGPAVGKSIRKLYSLLADGLDVELANRVADWFSIHMSNFMFQWVWKEWIPDLTLCVQHPKRVFMRKAVDCEIRLSYYDRILKTLPEPMQSVDAQVMPEESPGPVYEYDDPTSPNHDAAQTVLNLLRGRAKAEDVMSSLESIRNSIETVDSEANVDSIVRSIAVQSLLHIGSRSFSHFLNAIERYLLLLRNLASGSITTSGNPNLEARFDILNAVSSFWRKSHHMVAIVFDKLMQYQIVDPTDVVSWAFTYAKDISSGPQNVTAFQWEVIKGALDKANGRVMIARRRVTALRKEEDDNAAIAKASDSIAMEVDTTDAKPDIPQVESPALTTALKAFTTLTREQRGALSRTLDGFVDCLVSQTRPNTHASEVITEKAWHNRANWDEQAWLAWETWGWYRHFCRSYSPYLRSYATTLGTVSFSKVASNDDAAVRLFKTVWNTATGQDL
ncbi:Nuclear cap-binding protein subunit 1 [Abortiporus biennis]